jgi:hypothetical protein
MENVCRVYSDAKTTRTGLAFFATPHNGGREDLVALGAFASNIATFLGWKKGDNIIQTLKSGSLFTALLQDHWRHRLDQFNVVSFRGAEDDVRTLAPITTIVAGASATFGRSGDRERVVDLDGANHSTVCRFGDGDQDQYNLKKVKSNILYLYTKSKGKIALNSS